MEEWKAIAGYPDYAVSSMGRVKRLTNARTATAGKILKGELRWQYLSVRLYPDGKFYTIHRLVAQTFIGPIPPKMDINHLNGVKTDNRAENLEICTRQRNRIHAVETGLVTEIGINHRSAKLNEELVRKARQMKKDGHTTSAISRVIGVNHTSTTKVLNGVTWRHVA